jgi:hypothetical protein
MTKRHVAAARTNKTVTPVNSEMPELPSPWPLALMISTEPPTAQVGHGVELAPGVGLTVGAAAVGVGDGVGGAAVGVGDGVGGAAVGVGRAAGGVGDGVGGAAVGVGDGVGGTAVGVGDGVGGAAVGVGDGVGGAAVGVGDGVGGAAEGDGVGVAAALTVTQLENSDVSSGATFRVAVAVTTFPGTTAAPNVALKVTLPVPSVV